MRRLTGLFAFAAVGSGLAACALVSGLTDFSVIADDASTPFTKPPKEASADAPGVPDGGGDDAGDANDLPSDARDEALGNKAEAEADAPSADDAAEGGRSDAGDGGPPPDGGHPPDAGEGGCPLVVHMNGVGQTYTDCAPLDTYGADEAARACAAADAGTCAQNAILCVGGTAIECTQNANPCVCWSYSGSMAGHVNTSVAGILCGCPSSSDPRWH